MAARRLTATLIIAVVVVLGLCTTAGAAAPPPAHLVGGSSTGKHVFVVGDSITDLTAPDLTRSLKRYSYVIDATVGITMASSLPFIEQAVATTPQQYRIIELGTNDYNNPNAQQAFTNEINAVSTQSCVVLVTISPLLGKIASELDARMRAVAAQRPNVSCLGLGHYRVQQPEMGVQ